MIDNDDEGSAWWLYLLLVIVGIVIGSILSNLPDGTTKMTKEDISVIHDTAYDEGMMKGYQDCQSAGDKLPTP